MKNIYFASDFHLGASSHQQSQEREKRILRWLNSIKNSAKTIYLVGDIFDFWFEYKTVVPKGAVRLLGKLAELRDSGIDIHFFVGNHDIWMFDYFSTEIGITVHHQPLLIELDGQHFFIAHGDGLGPMDYNYKRLKKVFKNKLCQWLFSWLHPDIGIKIARFSSTKSRTAQIEPEYFLGKDKEWLLQYANRKIKELPQINYFVFGHRHLPLDIKLENQKSRYINLGEWFSYNTYAVFDGQNLALKAFENPNYDPTTAQKYNLYEPS